MEDIKNNLDKLLAKFNESVTNSAPKKLNFERLNESFIEPALESVSKKRRYSQSFEENSLEISNISNVSLNTSTSVSMSPWESRRVKADLIEAKTLVNKLKQENERLQKLHKESEILLQNRASELKKQCDFSSNKVQDLEKHLQIVRKREHQAKQELIKTQRELQQYKNISEETIMKLQKVKQDIEENARLMQNELANELNEFKRHAEKIELELELNSDELDTIKQQLMESKTKASGFDELRLLNEQTEQELEVAKSRIKELEFKIASYDDWKEITKNSQTRLLNMPNLDKELERLRSNNKNLQDLLGNKLLLEEQVYNLQNRLDKEDSARSELATVQVQLKYAQEELKEWLKVAEDHCPSNTLVSPLTLRARIEEILQNDVVMTSEKTSKATETKSMESELLDYKQKCEIFAKNMDELNAALKRHKTFKDRIQKKLLLISKERDCYKQLLDNYEKDLTVTNMTTSGGEGGNNMEIQLKCRIEMLEKTLLNYKELCGSLEKELSSIKNVSGGETSVECNVSVDSSVGYEHFKKELDALRLENERLRRRKEELELELEHRYLRGDFNCDKYKIVHMIQNPAAEAYENSKNVIEKLQAEIERLKRKNKKLEEDNELTQARLNETATMTINIKEMNQLKCEVESLNSKMRKMKECYKAASMELREVVYMLFGYRIDRVGANTNYKISSMYAESPDDYLNFRLNESNVLDMLETPYSVTLKPLIETQLVGNKSLPAFLSSLTLELFQRATITMS